MKYGGKFNKISLAFIRCDNTSTGTHHKWILSGSYRPLFRWLVWDGVERTKSNTYYSLCTRRNRAIKQQTLLRIVLAAACWWQFENSYQNETIGGDTLLKHCSYAYTHLVPSFYVLTIIPFKLSKASCASSQHQTVCKCHYIVCRASFSNL